MLESHISVCGMIKKLEAASCEQDGSRTHDTRNHNPLLYQLSYLPTVTEVTLLLSPKNRQDFLDQVFSENRGLDFGFGVFQANNTFFCVG